MSLNFFNIFLLFVSFAAFVICCGFITDCSRRVGGLPEKSTNVSLEAAHKYSIYASVVGWISVALLLVVAVLIFIYSAELYESGFANYLVTGLFFFTLVGCGVVGVLSAITASDINKSGVEDNNGSYKQAIIATIIGIIAFVLILIAFFVKLFYKPKSQTDKDIEKLKKELAEPLVRVGEPEFDMT